jgi:hypothetical protein
MSKISGGLNESLKKLENFPEIKNCINLQKYEEQINKKYPNGPEVLEGEVTDLFTASLISDMPIMSQQSTNAASPHGVLLNINDSIKELNFSQDDLKALGVKLVNLRTSSLWDTAAELFILRLMVKNLGEKKVGSEVKFGPVVVGKQQKDADFAILDDKGNPYILIDAVTPQRKESVTNAGGEIAKIITQKYDKKFKDYCNANPKANVAIVACMLKNEEWSLTANLPQLIVNPNYVATLPDVELKKRSGLLYGLACTFRCQDGQTLTKFDIAKYMRI